MRKTKKLFLRVLFCGEVCLFGYLYFFGRYGLCQLIYVKQETMHVRKQIDDVEQDIKVLENNIQCWQQGTFYKEKCAREELHMARPGEEVYYIN